MHPAAATRRIEVLLSALMACASLLYGISLSNVRHGQRRAYVGEAHRDVGSGVESRSKAIRSAAGTGTDARVTGST
jgi:hypothetical protein